MYKLHDLPELEASLPAAELLQQDVENVSEGGGLSDTWTQQCKQGFKGAEGLASMAGMLTPLKMLMASLKQNGYSIPFQHLQ